MEEKTYKQWWPLHLRVASGETLAGVEKQFYDSVLTHLHQEEILHEDVEGLRQIRQDIQKQKEENRRRQTERKRLETKIKALESMLSDQTRQLLSVGE